MPQRDPLETQTPPTAPTDPDSSVEEVGPGLTRQKMLGGRAYLFILSSDTRASIGAWIDAMKQIMTTGPGDQPVFLLTDASSVRAMTISPYMKARLGELYAVGRAGMTYAANVVAKSFVLIILEKYVQLLSRGKPIVTRFFGTRDDAAKWLQDMMKVASR
jgi:hypothetical protein